VCYAFVIRIILINSRPILVTVAVYENDVVTMSVYEINTPFVMWSLSEEIS
jgi:hypothetical protein